MKAIVCLIFIVCFAQTALRADPGFYPLDAKGVPKEVAVAAAKVLRLYRIDPQPIAMVTANEIPLFEEILRRDPSRILEQLNLVDPGIVDLWLYDLETWDRTKDFPISAGVVGSAFFVKSNILVTARHVFQLGKANEKFSPSVSMVEARSHLIIPDERILLRDSSGKFLVDTLVTPEALSDVLFSGHVLEVDGFDAEYREIEPSSLSYLMDLAAIRVKNFDGDAYVLELADSFPPAGTKVFGAGYPLPTVGRQQEKAADSDGRSVRVSYGSILSGAPKDYEDFLRRLPGDGASRSLYLESLALTNLDFHAGMSGGPILNPAGEVISLASTVRHDPSLSTSDKYSVVVSFGPKLKTISPYLFKLFNDK